VDFFKAQDVARRKTWQLGLLFVAAVVALVILTNIFVAFASLFMSGTPGALALTQDSTTMLTSIPFETWGWITFGVVGVVGTASLYKYLRLRGGGRVVAESFGGRLLTRDQASFHEKRVLNVVEEIAIASGLSVPPVYLLEESGINAFAAGHSPEDAVIGINRGTIELLNREELQGVVAHEFSHILNGDMKINLRLIAVLHGILFIGLLGRLLLRGSGNAGRKNGLPLLVFGLGFAAIGYGGTFFGNLIKAAVSRQREFLADAAAVQFTRNPGGIGSALKKIGGHLNGSTIDNSNAHEASHLFFAAVAPSFMRFLFATHPPLPDRIRAIDPRWDGNFPVVVPLSGEADQRDVGGLVAEASVASFTGSENTAESIVASVGNPDDGAVLRAQELITLAGNALTQAAHEALPATALMYAMLLSPDETTRLLQLEQIEKKSPRGVREETMRLHDLLTLVDHVQKTLLLDRAVPALKTLSTSQYRNFVQQVGDLVNMDHRIDLFEWMTSMKLIKDLSPHFLGNSALRVRFRSLSQVRADLLVLLASLSGIGNNSDAGRRAARVEGLRVAGFESADVAEMEPDFSAINHAMFRLRSLAPLQKPKVLKAAVATLMFERRLETNEAALLHLIAGALDCPLPPVAAHASA
jgi:Zn-dependent protease with chaperone function